MGQRMEQTFDSIGKNSRSKRIKPTFFSPQFKGVVSFSEWLSVSTGFYRHCSDCGPPT